MLRGNEKAIKKTLKTLKKELKITLTQQGAFGILIKHANDELVCLPL